MCIYVAMRVLDNVLTKLSEQICLNDLNAEKLFLCAKEIFDGKRCKERT